MRFRSAFEMAFRALGRNKMRTALTMLGITIGIAAVVCSVAVGQGGSQQVETQLDNIGDNMVWIEAGGRNVNGIRTGNDATKTLTIEDARAILRDIPLIQSVSPNVDGHVQVVYGNKNWYTSYRGDDPDMLAIRRWKVATGTTFTEQDVKTLANVCVLGQTVVRELFGDDDPLGRTIRVKNLPCKVIGTLEAKGLSMTGYDQDDFVLMPYTTVQHKIAGITWLDDIFTSAVSTDAIDTAQARISRLLRQRHHLRADEPDDFNIRHPEEILQARDEASQTFTILLASIASISLLVGGIGIMNIMLVSITERTREIGVRMAVGATEDDVRIQFLTEAVALSLMGGAAGVAVGIATSIGVANIFQWPAPISAMAIVVAALFSAAVGIFFGYYPARRASQLDPIEALRYE
ncbi:MAG: ABC transporter permease [Acidobacteriota bacterium]|nr:ABC transporter permease [Acidobacteriota bacterium]MDE3170068.1 ABC transporter permease [Acidobacteriota bacterium]